MKLTTPLTKDKLKSLRAGDLVHLSGTIYTARDAAHQRLADLLAEGKELPIPIKDSVIYYVGPTPTKPGSAIGSCGPTTSYRMDPFIEPLLDLGLSATIGKGARTPKIKKALYEQGCVYFSAIGGTAAYLSQFVEHSELIAFPELMSEAIRKLTVKDFPVFVIYDTYGNDLIEQGIKTFKK